MADNKTLRLNKVLRELNISLATAVEFLSSKGIEVEARPTTKISQDNYAQLQKEFQSDKSKKAASKEVSAEKRKEKEAMRLEQEEKLEKIRKQEEEAKKQILKAKADKPTIKKVGKIDLTSDKKKAENITEEPKQKPAPVEKKDVVETKDEQQKETITTETNILENKETQKVSNSEQPADIKTKDIKSEVKQEEIKPEPAKEVELKKEDTKKPEQKSAKPIDVANKFQPKKNTQKEKPQKEKKEEVSMTDAPKIETKYKKLDGPKLTGKVIDLKQFEKAKKKKPEDNKKGSGNRNQSGNKGRRKRITKPGSQDNKGGNNNNNNNNNNNRNNNSQGGNNRNNNNQGGNNNNRNRNQRPGQGGNGGNRGFRGKGRGTQKPVVKEEPTEAEVSKQIRETLERLQGKSNKNKGAKHRKHKRDQHRQQTEKQQQLEQEQSKILKVTEFVTVSEVATMMDIPVTQVISACMSLGMMVTMNQRLDAETLKIVAAEFGHDVEFISAEIEESIQEEEDKAEDLETRAPIITVMGHVDHGKTSLLDYIRKENVIAGESGGITQHIGAYSVELHDGQKLTFLDTPGHEAFTAMRARGAQVTDVVIIVVAADDDVMPQTKEAISHAQAAGVPIIFAINKVDKQTANPDRIKEQLASMNMLVEDWGGKYQSQEISAKTGLGVDELLEKVILESEVLELKANPNKNASGTIVEALLDKGRGYVATMLVQQGTLKIGDYVLAGKHSGKVRAMFNERGAALKVAGPSTPVSLLGLDGAPQAGDKFNVFEDEREAKQIATKRSQLQREQSVRTRKVLSLAEIGRRIALGNFKELNIILKGDVDGSVEALTDSFQKLSTEEIQVNIIHKGVGAITENDVLLASASDAIIIGFNVRPQGNARLVADKEEVDIRSYSIIYDAINDLKDAMEGMLSPEMREEVSGNVEIREVYKISKIGNIAGCMVVSGKIYRDSKIRIIREGVVIYSGELASLKRFKDDVKEVAKGYDCGLQIKNYNDIKEGDVIEAFKEVEVKKKLK
ncbi:translation initiation factor IF-2 [Aureivirga sp. CE67]|uniref:translation initiation factor IF-2 n=1 Tax=Aureivirga sp. CE67 TaxID=1788983 RepID=UPI0018CAA4C9|nr:translation initiation factor IF-2 [Aureivirga sp. CE67]